MIGRRIPRGAIRGIEEGTQFGLYSMYGYQWLEDRFLAMVTYQAAEFLEDNGFEAVPLPHLPPEIPPMGIPVSEDKPAPNVLMDFNDAAVRAGLGEIDYGGFLLSPEFGPRQRIQIILTEAVLEPDPVHEDVISECTPEEYSSFCPLGAINPDKNETIDIYGRKMVIGQIDYSKCRSCKNGAVGNRYYSGALPDRLGAACARSCIAYLETNGHLSSQFKNTFRQRPAWSIIDGRTYLEEGSEIE